MSESPTPEFLDSKKVFAGRVFDVTVDTVRDGDTSNLWYQPLDGSPGKQITNFKSERIGDNFQWSPDASQLAIIRGHVDSDVVLIRDAQ